MGLERGLLADDCATVEVSNSVHAEGTHQNDAHRLAIGNSIQQISGSYNGIEEEIGGSSLFTSSEMENKLHVLDCSNSVLAIPQVSDRVFHTNVGALLCQRIQLRDIFAPAHSAADIGKAVSQKTLDHSRSQKTSGARDEYLHAKATG